MHAVRASLNYQKVIGCLTSFLSSRPGWCIQGVSLRLMAMQEFLGVADAMDPPCDQSMDPTEQVFHATPG